MTNAQSTAFFSEVWAAGLSTRAGYDRNGLLQIPYVDGLSPKADSHGYRHAPNPSDADYTSWVGVQTYAKFSDQDNVWIGHLVGSLSFNSSYLQVKCSPVQAKDIAEFPAGVPPQMAVSVNVSSSSDSSEPKPAAFEIWYRTNRTKAAIQAMSSLCNITTVPVQVKAQCTAQGCVVKKMKPIDITESASYQTPFTDAAYAARFYSEILGSTGFPPDRDEISSAEEIGLPKYCQDNLPDGSVEFPTEIDVLTASLPENIQAAAAAHNLSVPDMYQYWEDALTNTSNDKAKQFVTPMFNTYLAMYQQNGYAYRAIYSDESEPTDVFRGDVSTPWLIVGSLHGTYLDPRYALSTPWIIIDFVSCLMLLLAALAAVYLRTKILAPDILGFVSTMTRDNPNVPLPQSGSTLGGMERARMMKKVKVQIADVKADHEVGKVSLTWVNADAEPGHTAKLSKARMYG